VSVYAYNTNSVITVIQRLLKNMGHHGPATGPRLFTAGPFERENNTRQTCWRHRYPSNLVLVYLHATRTDLPTPGTSPGPSGLPPTTGQLDRAQHAPRSYPIADYFLVACAPQSLLAEPPLMMSLRGGQARRQNRSLPPCPPRHVIIPFPFPSPRGGQVFLSFRRVNRRHHRCGLHPHRGRRIERFVWVNF
jgi:hypothetical protein